MKELLSKEAVILSGIPLLAFICVLVFEAGYANAFGYSFHFVEVELKNIIVSMMFICLILYPLYFYLEVTFRLSFSRKVTERGLGLTIFMLFPLISSLIFTGFPKQFVIVALAAILFAALIFMLQYFLKALKVGWKEAWAVVLSDGVKERDDTKLPSPTSELTTSDKVKQKIFIGAVLIFIYLLVRGVGVTVAQWQETYDVFTLDGTDVAILAGYGENLVLGGYENETFNGKIYIISKSSDSLSEITRVEFDDFLPSRTRTVKAD